MCPFCVATAVWITAAAVSTTGTAALVISKVASANATNHEPANSPSPKFPSKEKHNG